MENPILYYSNNKIYFNTFMNSSAFTRTRFAEKMNQNGLVAEKTSEGWSFLPWKFDESLLSPDGKTMYIAGEAKEGFRLLDILEDKNTAPYTAAVIEAIKAAVEKESSVPMTGAGGIYISKDKSQVIFLPEKLFTTCITSEGDDFYSKNTGFFINQMLDNFQNALFTQAVLIYKTVTSEFPFTSENSKERYFDIIDRNYIPLSQKVWALDTDLALFCENAIEQKNKTSYAETRLKDAKVLENSLNMKDVFRNFGLDEEGNAKPDGTLYDIIRKSKISSQEFEEKNLQSQKLFEKKLKVKRFFRTYKTTFVAAAGVFAVMAVLSVVFYRDSMRKPTTKGLNATEVTEAFFSAYNTMDVVQATQTSSGRVPRAQIDVMSNFYVASKSTSAYDSAYQTVSPSEWINYNNDGKYKIYGITQFYIDGQKGHLYLQAPAKSEKLEKVTEENGNILVNGSTVKKNVQFYLLADPGEGGLLIQTHNDTVTLTYKNNRWVLTDIDFEVSDYSISEKELYEDYYNSWLINGSEPVKIAEDLREKYNFLPTNSEILEAFNYMQEKWNLLDSQ